MEEINSKEGAKELWGKIDNIIFDCDGVLWRGEQVIEGARQLIALLHQLGKKVFYVTNNSTKSRKMYADRFKELGFEGVEAEDILCSAFSAAFYLSTNSFSGKVFIVGEKGIEEELKEHKIEFTKLSAEDNEHPSSLNIDQEVKAVVVGLDRHITYAKIATALRYLEDPSTLFIATNTDATYPSHAGLLPGSGAIVASIQTCSSRKPIVTGKPSPVLLNLLKDRFHFEPTRTLMIGDRLDTDILFGKEGGFHTLLVLSGVSARSSIQQLEIFPSFIANSVADLIFE